MSDIKKYISVLCVAIAAALTALAVATLFAIQFSLPFAVWFSAALGIEAAAGWIYVKMRSRQLNAKAVCGILFCVSLVLALVSGLCSAVIYLAQNVWLKISATSFPWYTGLAFAAVLIGPVIISSGIGWVIFHLREDKRNVRDIRLLSFLLLIGTGVLAVLWTADRIHTCIVYPNAYSHPWHASIFYGLLYYGPLLAVEGCVFALLRHREKKLIQSGVFAPDLQTEAVKTAAYDPEMTGKPGTIIPDICIAVLPLAAAVLLMLLLLDTKHIAYDIMTVVGNAAAAGLMMLIPAWLVRHYFADERKMRYLQWLAVLILILTVAAMFCWCAWFAEAELVEKTGLPQYAELYLGIGYFGPFLLGEAIACGLICRMRRRMGSAEAAEEKRSASVTWAALLLVIPVFVGLILWLLLVRMDYRYEVAVRIVQVEQADGSYDQFRLTTEVHISEFYIESFDEIDFEDTDASDNGKIFLTNSAVWKPFGSISQLSRAFRVHPDADVTEIYIYKQPDVFELEAVRDLETGKWLLGTADP